MRFSPKLLPYAAYAMAGLLAYGVAHWSAVSIEQRSKSDIRSALVDAGYVWADVHTDGLQVLVTGQAPSESQRFRALSVAGEHVDPGRVRDGIQVVNPDAFKAPDFSLEVLRNGDGISLIGLVPSGTDRAAVVAHLKDIAGDGAVTDLLDTADHPVPASWAPAMAFALSALEGLPRSKVSVAAGHVTVVAITDSAAEKAKVEATLRADAPKGVQLDLDISAPRPVIAPFTLRFIKDQDGARFDACAADDENARDRIIAAAADAGASGGGLICPIGLGVPSPAWADAATMAIAAIRDLGTGTLTMADADIALAAPDTVSQAIFDKVVGTLESNLPDVFSLHSERVATEDTTQSAERPEFSAELADTGKVTLSGRVPDVRTRDAVQNFAQSRFGKDNVFLTVRLDDTLPQGWAVRVLASVEALDELNSGSVQVQDDRLAIKGVSGKPDASGSVARIFSEKLGTAGKFDIAVRYDKKLDALLGLPTPAECVENLNAVLAAKKISFEPGSATIAIEAKGTLDKLASAMKNCTDYPMEVGGHTDAQGREEMNLQLSQSRAQSVINALMERRVLTGQLTAKGYGEAVPIGDNQTEAGREANRRIEITLLDQIQRTTGAAAVTVGAGGPAVAVGADAPVAAASAGSGVAVSTPEQSTLRPKANPHYPATDTGAPDTGAANAGGEVPPGAGGSDAGSGD